MVAQWDVEVEQMDVNTTFLHGGLEEDIYMSQPQGFIEASKGNLVCRLKKSLYGLKQSPRQWYKRFDTYMLRIRYRRCESDCFLCSRVFKDRKIIMLILYVDDVERPSDEFPRLGPDALIAIEGSYSISFMVCSVPSSEIHLFYSLYICLIHKEELCLLAFLQPLSRAFHRHYLIAVDLADTAPKDWVADFLMYGGGDGVDLADPWSAQNAVVG
ncbi:PREDICTED: uncharacterized protein LOC107880312 [Prunus mume]|uniref:Uncharacterized protein LOC107880312 n=1 Tax=Prunus mume TaxID=102107 RepID=A0ABM1LI44_PRUMU|nr:PREDICTED: uncharacterized protein LOC107880312 [Prunus mume]